VRTTHEVTKKAFFGKTTTTEGESINFFWGKFPWEEEHEHTTRKPLKKKRLEGNILTA